MGKRPLGRWGKGTHEPFIMIYKRQLESGAWLDLSYPAMVAWIYLKKQKNTDDCEEHIKLPYGDPDNPLSKRTFARAIKELIQHGFIELEQKGGLMKRPNIYKLSDKWETWKEDTPYPYI
jgi:hypothetical protein